MDIGIDHGRNTWIHSPEKTWQRHLAQLISILSRATLITGIIFMIGMPASAAHVLTTISLPPGGATSFSNLAAYPSTNYLYVGSYPPRVIYAINRSSNSWISIPVSVTYGDIAVNPVTGKVYHADQGTGSVTVIDGNTNGILYSVPVPGCPTGIAANENTNKIYVNSQCTGDFVYVIDGSTDTLLPGSISLTGPSGHVAGPAVADPVANRIYARSTWDTTVIDGSTDTAIATIPSFVASAVDPAGNRVYGSCPDGTQFCAVNASTYASEFSISLGSNPGEMEVDENTGRVYITLGGANSLVIFDGNTDQEITRVTVGNNPQGVSINPDTNLVYVANSGDGTISVVQDVLPPVAGFTGTPTSGTAPLTVIFTDTSANTPASWNWSFGDGSLVNATDQNPVHTYAGAGTYTVSLNATNTAGSDTLVRGGYITVNAAPVPPPVPVQPVVTSFGSSGGSSSSGSGAGASTAAAPAASRGETITFVFNRPPSSASPVGIQQVQVIPSQDVGPVEMRAVSVDPGPSLQVQDRQVVGYERIEPLGLKPDAIGRGRITFTVSGAWLTGHQVTPAEIALERYHDGGWADVPTRFDHEGAGLSHFVADTPGFSYFAITVKPPGVSTTPVPTPSMEAAASQTRTRDTPEPVVTGTTAAPAAPGTPPWSGIPVIAGIVILVAVAVAALFIRHRWMRRQNPALFRELD
jgi:PGF-pre-PGF domain-containing protein